MNVARAFAHGAVVVLAAGASRRLGQPKQQVRVGGRSLLAHTLDVTAELGAAQCILVVGDHGAADDAPLHGIQVVHNRRAHEGMASSLGLGLECARAREPALAAVLFTVCDQPTLSAPLLHALLAALDAGFPMAAASYAGTLGVPAAFSAVHFDDLGRLRGDEGARHLLRAPHARVHGVPFPGGALDVDTPSDLARLTQRTRQ